METVEIDQKLELRQKFADLVDYVLGGNYDIFNASSLVDAQGHYLLTLPRINAFRNNLFFNSNDETGRVITYLHMSDSLVTMVKQTYLEREKQEDKK